MKNLLLFAAIALISSCSTPEDELAEKGGHSFLMSVEDRVDDAGAKIPITEMEVDQVIRVIEDRLEAMGIAELIVTREGKSGIMLKLPGVEPGEAERISAMLGKTSKLELREVSPRNAEVNADGKTLAQRVQDGAEIVPGYRAYTHRLSDEDGNEIILPILLNRRAALGGADIASAALSPQQQDAVQVMLDEAGTEKMIAFTKDMRPGLDRIAIVLDGEVVSAPVVTQTPLGKHFIITGLRKPGEAQDLAISVMHPLDSAIKIKEVRRVPPIRK
jgi:SecD/SecF fusion protein